jgi:hypothetical protein
MPITTSMSASYGLRMLFIAVLMVVFGAWGGYDYLVKIPRLEQTFARYEQAKTRFDQMEEKKNNLHTSGMTMAEREKFKVEYDDSVRELESLAPGGAPPAKPGKWDRLTCWFFILCLPCAPYFFVLYAKAKKQKYRLEEDGTLHFNGDPEFGTGAWAQDEITDIDMSRWMKKSIAHVVHKDGKRLKLDAYLHKNLELIIGAIAARLHPDDWTVEAKPRKADESGAAAAEANETVAVGG